MMPLNNIHIEESLARGATEGEIEIVERKGLGHPDTICDLVMEAISQALSSAYLEFAEFLPPLGRWRISDLLSQV